MTFLAHRELLELNLKLELTSNRLSTLEREAGMFLRLNAERGVPPEGIEQIITVLELTDTELEHVENNIKQCRNLIKNTFKTLGYDDNNILRMFGSNESVD